MWLTIALFFALAIVLSVAMAFRRPPRDPYARGGTRMGSPRFTIRVSDEAFARLKLGQLSTARDKTNVRHEV
jgi:hypothetical protein